LFDADCGLCTASARWLSDRATGTALRILPLARASGAAYGAASGAAAAGAAAWAAAGAAAWDTALAPRLTDRDLARTLHLVTPDGTVLTGARAVLTAARTVPRWGAIAGLVDHRIGHALLEPAYRLVAANRHRIGRRLGLAATCGSPPRRLR
ncbi:MAG: thiol-disulfide oxidoreductase DCC family protein, partial [Candidatus Limnocylindrales bacterium]